MKLGYLITPFLLFTISFAETPGAAYSGPYVPSSPVILSNINDTVIEGLEITNTETHCIDIRGCRNVTIKNCLLRNAVGNGIRIGNSQNISIENCRIDSVASGVYALNSSTIKVTYNTVKNVLGPKPRRQFAQFDKVYGEGNTISYNVAINIMGESSPEDVINIYKSNGTATSPIEVIGNWIRGGGPSRSGGGIMTGDGGSSSYILVKDNILVDPGQYGIAIASGEYITIANNKVFGREQSFTNVGIYVWNQYDSPCNNHTVINNKVKWTNQKGQDNSKWNGWNCGEISGWSNNEWGANIDASILPDDLGDELVTNIKWSSQQRENKDIIKQVNIRKNICTIQFDTPQKDVTMQLYSLSGQAILEKYFENDTQVSFPFQQPNGMYIIKLISNNNIVSTFRLTKTR